MATTLKEQLITIILSSVLTSVGWVVIQNYNEEKRQEHFVNTLHKDLYDKSAVALEDIDDKYSKLLAVYSEGFGLSTYEYKKEFDDFAEAVKYYQIYVKELKRYGNSSQVQAASSIENLVWALYGDFYLHYKAVQQLEDSIKSLLINERPGKDLYELLSQVLDPKLDDLIQLENRIYYEITYYKKPLINAYREYLNYHFRLSIGLQATEDMAKEISSIEERSKRDPKNEYTDKALPFMFSENRVYQGPALNFSEEDKFLSIKMTY